MRTVITGSSRGIGLQLCAQLAAAGHDVIALCRRPSKELEALKVEVVPEIDVGTDTCMARLRQAIGRRHIDWLINNAGVLHEETIDSLDIDRIREQLEVNSLGPLRVIKAVLDHLGQGSKIGLVTSRMGSLGDNTSGGYYGYRMSKCALTMAGVSLAHDLRPRGIAVAILHPGYVRTDMTDHLGDVTPEVAARGLIARMEALTLGTSGTFWHANGTVLPW